MLDVYIEDIDLVREQDMREIFFTFSGATKTLKAESHSAQSLNRTG
jgi:hypothetical protein